ncbi:MAG: RNA polymerase sigma factor [Planctomycetota bacterium]
MNGFSDEILVAAAQRGDKSAYSLLVKRHYRYVFAVCLGMLGNVHDAEDMAQDAMLKGYLKISELRRGKQFGEWIGRIAKNLCIDSVRSRKRPKALRPEQVSASPRASAARPDLERALGRLPLEFRVPLMMYYFDNKSARTIAEKLKISYSGVCQRIRAARKQLHRLLSEGVQDE